MKKKWLALLAIAGGAFFFASKKRKVKVNADFEMGPSHDTAPPVDPRSPVVI